MTNEVDWTPVERENEDTRVSGEERGGAADSTYAGLTGALLAAAAVVPLWHLQLRHIRNIWAKVTETRGERQGGQTGRAWPHAAWCTNTKHPVNPQGQNWFSWRQTQHGRSDVCGVSVMFFVAERHEQGQDLHCLLNHYLMRWNQTDSVYPVAARRTPSYCDSYIYIMYKVTGDFHPFHQKITKRSVKKVNNSWRLIASVTCTGVDLLVWQ